MFSFIKHRVYKIRILGIIIFLIALLFFFWLNKGRSSSVNPDIYVGVDIHTISFSVNDEYIAVASLRNGLDDRFHWFNGGVQIYDVATHKIHTTVKVFHQPYNPEASVGAFYSSDGKQLIVKNTDNQMIVYDALTLETVSQKPSSAISSSYISWSNGCTAKIISKNGKNITVIKKDNHLFNVHTRYAPALLSIDPTNRKLAIGDISGGVYIFDTDKCKIAAYISCGAKSFNKDNDYNVISNLIWLPEQQTLWISNIEGRSVFWDSSVHKVISDVLLPKVISCSAISHKGNSIVFGTNEGLVRTIPISQLLNSIKSGNIIHLFK